MQPIRFGFLAAAHMARLGRARWQQRLLCRKVNAEIVRLLSKHTGNDEEKISEDINRPKYFSAYDAQDYGLIDRVLESEEKDVTEALESISKGKYEWNLADKEEEKESET